MYWLELLTEDRVYNKFWSGKMLKKKATVWVITFYSAYTSKSILWPSLQLQQMTEVTSKILQSRLQSWLNASPYVHAYAHALPCLNNCLFCMHKNLKFYVLPSQLAKDGLEAELAWVLGLTCHCMGGQASGLKAN